MKEIKKIFKNIYWSIKSFLMALFSRKRSYNKLLKVKKHYIDMAERYYKFLFSID